MEIIEEIEIVIVIIEEIVMLIEMLIEMLTVTVTVTVIIKMVKWVEIQNGYYLPRYYWDKKCTTLVVMLTLETADTKKQSEKVVAEKVEPILRKVRVGGDKLR